MYVNCSDKVVMDAAQIEVDYIKSLIKEINTEITYDSIGKMLEAEMRYQRLTPEQQELVTNYSELLSARVKYVEFLIVDIGEFITEDSLQKIEIAEMEYNSLTEDQKALVSNYNVLVEAREEYERTYGYVNF